MGQFNDMLNKMMIVESMGFNPYIETYSSRMGKIPTQPTNGTSSDDDPVYSGGQISEAYITEGYDDPFANLVTDTGELNLSQLSTGYNLAPELGIDQQQYIDFVNKEYQQNVEDYYGVGNRIEVREGGALGITKPKTTKPNYRFEQGVRQGDDLAEGKFKKGDPIYYRWDDNTGKYITYDTKEAYDKARENYKKTTGEESNLGQEK
jgi:hypothetical protein